jgi:hypothetical protein
MIPPQSKAYREYMARLQAERLGRMSVGQKGRATYAVFVLLGGIVAAIASPALRGVVSGENVAFFAWAIVGYLFCFMRRDIIGVKA